MRISVVLVIFLVLFNSWGGLLQDYGIDDHLGISAETGDAGQLGQAAESANQVQTGGAVEGTLLGYYNALLNALEGILLGIQPGAQMLVNVAPPGIVEDIIIWAFSIMPFIAFADIAAYARGVDL